jgi:hypothetical protein
LWGVDAMGKNSRQKFTHIWANQTDLGKQFGLSTIVMGRKLKELGLREDNGNPTELALGENYCIATPLKSGKQFFMWSKQKVNELMQSSGYQKLDALEVKARELADDWMRVHRRYQQAIHHVEEELLYEEAQDICQEARLKCLISRVNELLCERRFDGELLT